jgi:GNAT superfamily N-acetyltransferase
MLIRPVECPPQSSSSLRLADVICWEALDPGDKTLRQARRLYKASLPAEERIPWRWIKHKVADRCSSCLDERNWHLFLAGPRRRSGSARPVVGLTYGAHVAGFGGYVSYIAVSEEYRGRRVGFRLLELLIQVLKVDAACAGTALPFVVWESRQPEADALPEEQALWQSRLRLFGRVGAYQVNGLTFLAPNFSSRDEPPVPLQLFVVPVDLPVAAFDARRLREVAAGLHREVYGLTDNHPLVRHTLPLNCRPSLQPLAEDNERSYRLSNEG